MNILTREKLREMFKKQYKKEFHEDIIEYNTFLNLIEEMVNKEGLTVFKLNNNKNAGNTK